MIHQADSRQLGKVLEVIADRGLHGGNVGTVVAYVNHGRWVADCPCGGSELVAVGERFDCGSCGGRGTVEWPDNMNQVEVALGRRRFTKNQNWLPGETMADLEAQNVLMGVD
jgi:hypothetical protein